MVGAACALLAHGLLLARCCRVGLSRGRVGTLAQWNGTRPVIARRGMSRLLEAAVSGSYCLMLLLCLHLMPFSLPVDAHGRAAEVC